MLRRFVRPTYRNMYYCLKFLSTRTAEIFAEGFNVNEISISDSVGKCEMEPLSRNIDLIEITPYEHYFNFIDQVIRSNYVPIRPDLSTSVDDLKLQTTILMNGCRLLKMQSTLPTAIIDAIRVVENRLISIFPTNSKKTRTIGNDEHDYKFTFNFLQRCIKNTDFNTAFIDVCIQTGDFENAFKKMTKVRVENKTYLSIDRASFVVNARFFEPAISLLSHRGKLSAIVNLLSELDLLGILPSLSIIVKSLEAAGRKTEINSVIVQRLFAYLHHHNVSPIEAVTRVNVAKDSAQYITKAIQSVNPDFQLLPVNRTSTEIPETVLENTPINVNKDELKKYFDKQLECERGLTSIEHIFPQGNVDKSKEAELKKLSKKWRNSLVDAFKNSLVQINNSDYNRLKPFFTVFSEDIYANIMLKMVFVLVADSEMQFSTAQFLKHELGREVYKMYEYKCLKRQKYFGKLKTVFQKYFSKVEQQPNSAELSQLWEDSILENISEGSLAGNVIEWSETLQRDIGAFLYKIMTANLNFSENSSPHTPVLFEKIVETHSQIFVVVNVHETISTLIKSLNKAVMNIPPEQLPMLHPPVPLSRKYSTGFLYSKNYATRMIREVDHKLYDEDLNQADDITQIYNAINTLGLCAWRIDNENLKLIKKTFKNGGNLKLKIPLNAKNLPRPPKPVDGREMSNYFADIAEYNKEKKEMNSLWLTLLYKLNIADKYKDQNIWFPYSMDFRSRIYPCPPHFNHIGDDVGRGLLRFARGKPLGHHGLDWLRIHLVNLYGSHKRHSNSERLKAAEDSMAEVWDSATKPFEGRKWWQESDKPWQTLLVCREIVAALRFADKHGAADRYVSHLGVHQDGSCNGLQHYAALARDREGAQAVNLTNMSTPQDVYSDVLHYVEQRRKEDAANGVPEAKLLEGLVNRKVIKQTVMTTVYGVTQFGATNQIRRQLKNAYDLPNETLFKCSVYLSKTTLNSIGQLFKSATKIKNWFTECASAVGSERKSNIQWKTPLNMVVTQPYFKDNHDNSGPRVNVAKNRNAFPPNFVHSLDSSHMMLTALRCWQEQVTFVSVHDCFWTHACDVDRMNQICREEFVKMYSQPILQNLSSYLMDNFGYDQSSALSHTQKKFNSILQNIPKEGSFDIEDVLKSTYFFS